jgi:ribosomal-protein-alanine N-acetyltransferase
MFYLDDLESERLYFKPLSHFYDKDWGKYLSDKTNTKFYPKIRITDPLNSDLWIQAQLDRYEAGTYGMCAVHLKETDEFIGQAGALIQEVDGQKEFEVGYHLFNEFTGKGYATEAATHFKNWLFNTQKVTSVISIIREDNIPSQKVAERHRMKVDVKTIWREMPVLIYRQAKEDYTTS